MKSDEWYLERRSIAEVSYLAWFSQFCERYHRQHQYAEPIELRGVEMERPSPRWFVAAPSCISYFSHTSTPNKTTLIPRQSK